MAQGEKSGVVRAAKERAVASEERASAMSWPHPDLVMWALETPAHLRVTHEVTWATVRG